MSRAIELADGQLGRVAPNPAVGCLLVRDGEIIAEAATADGGRPHAETQAIEKAGDCRGATAYVTLEPCAHHGKTPPCAEAIVKAGIKRVVIAVRDPDPRTSGRGVSILKNAGIEVIEDVMSDEAALLNRGFFLTITEKRPLIALKIASSADGKIALADSKPILITNEETREYTHYLRSRYDAIAIGSGTLIADDPMLNCRLPGLEKYSPTRVILDRRLRITPNHRIAATAREIPSWVFTDLLDRHTGESRYPEKTKELMAAGATIFPYDNWLKTLAENGITRLMVEGGAELAANLLPLADELFWFSAPLAIGDDGIKAFPPLDKGEAEKLPMQLVETRFFGDNQLRYFRRHNGF